MLLRHAAPDDKKGDVSRLRYVVVVGSMGNGDIRFKGDRGRWRR